MHLDPTRHSALLAGTLAPDEARALARHLEAGCEPCEAFLASRGAVDAADGRVDRALAALADGGAAGSDVEFAHIAWRLASPPARRAARALRRAPGRVVRLAPVWAAAAVLLAVGGAALLALRERPGRLAWDGVKGSALAVVPVRLRFLVVEGEGAGASLRRGASGDAVPAAAGLGFEVELDRPAHVALVRVPPDGVPDAFWAGLLGAGSTVVALGDRPAVYRLDGLNGRQRFVAVASASPLGAEALARAAASAAAGKPAPGAAGADVLEVHIE